MVKSFHEYLRRINEEGPPPPPPGGAGGGPPPAGGAPPPPGGDPLAGGGMGGPPPPGGGMGGPPMPGGDPMGGAGGGAPGGGTRKGINITTVWDAIRDVLGNHAERQSGLQQHTNTPKNDKPQGDKKPKSIIQ
jgi:hypothetical protein